jgi:hypothetical protein
MEGNPLMTPNLSLELFNRNRDIFHLRVQLQQKEIAEVGAHVPAFLSSSTILLSIRFVLFVMLQIGVDLLEEIILFY